MATTTFSGPVKAGSIREGASANTGFVLMAQSAVIDIIGATATTNVGIIPANSQIIDCVIDIITAANSTTNLSVGDTVGGAATIVNTFASGTDAGRKYPTTEAGGALAWQDTGTSDIRLTVTASAATNAGLVRFTILYAQNNNLA